jgi:hypothetical protein
VLTANICRTAPQGTCVDTQLEAAWCITNIAASSSAHTAAALVTAPCLIQLLRSGSSAVQEQCVWALGNMAGDNQEFRDRIRANGAAGSFFCFWLHPFFKKVLLCVLK